MEKIIIDSHMGGSGVFQTEITVALQQTTRALLLESGIRAISDYKMETSFRKATPRKMSPAVRNKTSGNLIHRTRPANPKNL